MAGSSARITACGPGSAAWLGVGVPAVMASASATPATNAVRPHLLGGAAGAVITSAILRSSDSMCLV